MSIISSNLRYVLKNNLKDVLERHNDDLVDGIIHLIINWLNTSL